jgi:hypothetical protein
MGTVSMINRPPSAIALPATAANVNAMSNERALTLIFAQSKKTAAAMAARVVVALNYIPRESNKFRYRVVAKSCVARSATLVL